MPLNTQIRRTDTLDATQIDGAFTDLAADINGVVDGQILDGAFNAGHFTDSSKNVGNESMTTPLPGPGVYTRLVPTGAVNWPTVAGEAVIIKWMANILTTGANPTVSFQIRVGGVPVQQRLLTTTNGWYHQVASNYAFEAAGSLATIEIWWTGTNVRCDHADITVISVKR